MLTAFGSNAPLWLNSHITVYQTTHGSRSHINSALSK